MTDQLTTIPPLNYPGTGYLYVDANILVNFDRIGRLDLLTLTNRTVVITEEVYREAVTNAHSSNNPIVYNSAQRIADWLDDQISASARIEILGANTDGRPVEFGPDAGERSIQASLASTLIPADSVVMSDDGAVAFSNFDGASFPVFTGNYYLLGLLLEGEISPATYFSVIARGAADGGFNPGHFPQDASSILESGGGYTIALPGGVTGHATFNSVGLSAITLSDGRVITMFPWMTRDIVGGEGVAPCFAAGTPILLADGTSIAIEDIAPGMRVAAFDEADAAGTGALQHGRVARLIAGITEEWMVLDDGTRVTPGHRYLCPPPDAHGPDAAATFATIADILGISSGATHGSGLVVAADGAITRITGTLLRATDAGSDATWLTPEAQAQTYSLGLRVGQVL